MAHDRYAATASTLPSGQVLVAGGGSTTAAGTALASAERYDPASGTWVATASLATGRMYATATSLPDGTVLAAGGYSGSVGRRRPLRAPAGETGTASMIRAVQDRRRPDGGGLAEQPGAQLPGTGDA